MKSSINNQLSSASKRINKQIMNSIVTRIQTSLSNVGKTRRCCQHCLIKIERDSNGEWIECNHQTNTISSKTKVEQKRNKEKQKRQLKPGTIGQSSKKQLVDLDKYKLQFKKDDLLIESLSSNTKQRKQTLQSTLLGTRKQDEIENHLRKQQVKLEKKSNIKKSYSDIFKQTILKPKHLKQAYQQQSEQSDREQNQSIQLSSKQSLTIKDENNIKLKIPVVHFQQDNEIQDGQNYDQIEHSSYLQRNILNQNKLLQSVFEQESQHSRSDVERVVIKVDQSTMTDEFITILQNDSQKQHLINFDQFKQCIERLYSLLSKGKLTKLEYKYEQKYRDYLKQMEDKFMKSRQNMMELQSSIEELGRKVEFGPRNSYSHHNSGHNSKRSSLECQPFQALLSSINEETVKHREQIHNQNHIHDYLRFLVIQSQSLQKLVEPPIIENYHSSSRLEDMIG